MDTYYQVLSGYLTTGGYTLPDAASRIDYGVAAGKLTPDEASALLTIAEGRAGGVGVQEQVMALAERVAALEATVRTLEPVEGGGSSDAPGGDEGGSSDPYADVREYIWPPTPGVTYIPNAGELARYGGHIWSSNINANTTKPGSDPRWWTKVA